MRYHIDMLQITALKLRSVGVSAPHRNQRITTSSSADTNRSANNSGKTGGVLNRLLQIPILSQYQALTSDYLITAIFTGSAVVVLTMMFILLLGSAM